MRTETEMLTLIKNVALQDDNIRAAYIEGSRTNPEVTKDIFQDYDIVYIVNSTKPFQKDKEWVERFGEILYMHYPEDNVFYPSDVENCYGWQLQFVDGNRMDLHVCTKENALENLEMYQIIVDKDGILPEPSEDAVKRYHVKKPQDIEFQCTCSNFWWCTNNVAKGLWRKEIPFAMDVLNYVLRLHLLRLLDWEIGYEHDFSISTGKSGKYIEKYLPKEKYAQFLKTYPVGNVEAVWDAVFEMCDLFQGTAVELSTNMNFSYDYVKAKNCLSFLEHVRQLPADAEGVYF